MLIENLKTTTMTERQKSKSIIVTTGGTGGHIFPADAFAKEMKTRGWTVRFLTDQRGMMYADSLSADKVVRISSASPNIRKPLKFLIAIAKLKIGTMSSLARMIFNRPRLVAGFGGYSSFPVLLAALILRIPIIVHEQNTVLGRVNRFVANRAIAVASGFKKLDRLPSHAKHIVTGNPIRQEFVENKNSRYPNTDRKLSILVTGGSLGAQIFGEILPKAFCSLPEKLRTNIVVVQQALPDQIAPISELYKEHRIEARLQPFFDNMPELIVQSHLVIARSGASSVCEIACIGRPAIFVPLKIAMDDHQSVNAKMLVDAGLADSISEDEISVELMASKLLEYLSNPALLQEKAKQNTFEITLSASANLSNQIEALIKKKV